MEILRYSLSPISLAVSCLLFLAAPSAATVPLSSSLSLNLDATICTISGGTCSSGAQTVSGTGADSQGTTLNPLAASASASASALLGYPLGGSESWTASFTSAAQGAVSITSLKITAPGLACSLGGPCSGLGGDVTFGTLGSGIDNGFYYTFVPDASGNLVVSSVSVTTGFSDNMPVDGVWVATGSLSAAYFPTNSQSFPANGAGSLAIPVVAGTAYTLGIFSGVNCGGSAWAGCGVQHSAEFTFSIPSGSSAPAISPGGVVPASSSVNTIQPGEWVSIYGMNLADSNVTWTGNFPTSLGGTSVTIDGKLAYLSYVSPGQINLQAPDDAATGSVPVVVTTPSGMATSTVALAPFGPSFLLLDSKHAAGIILRPNGSGAYGGGTYDILGPNGNSVGYATVAAQAGDIIELFAVGLGPTNPAVPAGQAFSGAAPTTNPVNLVINGVNVIPSFAGLSSAGLYQLNLTVPVGLGTGDVSLLATVGGAQTPPNVVISLQ